MHEVCVRGSPMLRPSSCGSSDFTAVFQFFECPPTFSTLHDHLRPLTIFKFCKHVFIQQICSRRVGSTCSEQADAGKLSPPAWFKETFTVSQWPLAPSSCIPTSFHTLNALTSVCESCRVICPPSCSLTSASCLRRKGSRCTLVGFWPHKWDCTRVIFW